MRRRVKGSRERESKRGRVKGAKGQEIFADGHSISHVHVCSSRLSLKHKILI